MQTERAFDSRDRQGLRADSDDQMWRKKRAQKSRVVIQEEIIRPKNLKVRFPISVKDLASEMKLKILSAHHKSLHERSRPHIE